MLTDLKVAVRSAFHNRGLASAVVLTFAIAIGANTAGHLSKREYRELVKTTQVAEGYASYYPTQYTTTNPPEAVVSVEHGCLVNR